MSARPRAEPWFGTKGARAYRDRELLRLMEWTQAWWKPFTETGDPVEVAVAALQIDCMYGFTYPATP